MYVCYKVRIMSFVLKKTKIFFSCPSVHVSYKLKAIYVPGFKHSNKQFHLAILQRQGKIMYSTVELVNVAKFSKSPLMPNSKVRLSRHV